MAKLWGGRFAKSTDALLERFNASIGFDQRLYAVDITGSIAYAQALADAGVLTPTEAATLEEGLRAVRAEFEAGTFEFQPTDEDIHTAVERRLMALVGPVAGKLHTGRSRNDQVATDVRLYLLGKIVNEEDGGLRGRLRALQAALIQQAEAYLDVMMPGYTHLQPAQPILFSHWMMAFFWMF